MRACNIRIEGKDNGIIGSYINDKGREVEGFMLKNLIEQYEEDCTEIHLYINSVGGDVDEGQKMYDYLKSTGKKIVSIVDGVCYSIATILLLAADEQNRFITDGSLIMIHLPFLSGLDCNDNGMCNADFLTEAAEYVREKENQLLDTYQQTISKCDREMLKAMMMQETFMDSAKAIELGFVSGTWANGKKQVGDKIKAVANWNEKFKINNNYSKMAEKKEIEEVLEKHQSFFSKKIADLNKAVFGLFKKIKNVMELSLEDGTKIAVDSEDGEFAGKKVMKADSGEPLEAGTYKLTDGRSLIVDGESTITSVQLNAGEVNNEMQALQEKLAAMESELAAMKTKNEDLEDPDAPEPPVDASAKNEVSEEVVKNLLSEVEKLAGIVKNLTEIEEAKEGTDNPKYPSKNYKATMTNAQKKLQDYANYIAKKYDVRDFKTGELVVKNLAVIEPNLDYTYNGLETLEILIKPVIETPDFLRLFSLVQGVRSKKQLFVTTTLRNIIKLAQSCNPTPVGANVDIDNRTLEVAELGFELEQCAEVFDETIFEEWLKALSVEKNNLEGTEVETLLRTLVGEAMKYDFWNIFSFGDTSSPSDKYDQLDGLWTKLLAGASEANNDPNGDYTYCTKRLADITSLTDSAGTTAYDYLRETFENAPVLLRGEIAKDTRNAGFFVTPNIYYNYQAYLETRTGVEGAWIMLQDGTKQLAFRGIPIYNIPAWEASLNDTDNPLNGELDTLILLTHVKNHYVGVQEPRDFGQFTLWYDRNADVTRMRLKAKLGYEYAHCDLQVIKVGLVG